MKIDGGGDMEPQNWPIRTEIVVLGPDDPNNEYYQHIPSRTELSVVINDHSVEPFGLISAGDHFVKEIK